jgi:hypothetical protein
MFGMAFAHLVLLFARQIEHLAVRELRHGLHSLSPASNITLSAAAFQASAASRRIFCTSGGSLL